MSSTGQPENANDDRMAPGLAPPSILAVCAAGALMAVAGLARLAFGNDGYRSRAIPTPDRKSIVFDSNRDGTPHAYRMDLETGAFNRLTQGDVIEKSPALSSDGTTLVYTAPSGEFRHIGIVDLGNGARRTITSGEFVDTHPSFSPDGARVVFRRGHSYRPFHMGGYRWYDWDVVCTAVDGSSEHRLTEQGFYDMTPPYFSPDGQTVLFSATELGGRTSQQIFALDVSSGYISRVTDNDRYSMEPAYSADGKQIVFISDRAIPYEYVVWMMNADGSDPRQVTPTRKKCSVPQFLPDGKSILYFCQAGSGDRSDLWRIDIDGQNARRIAKAAVFSN